MKPSPGSATIKYFTLPLEPRARADKRETTNCLHTTRQAKEPGASSPSDVNALPDRRELT